MTSGERLGFVGTGAITEAIVTGILSGEGAVPDIILSPRSAATAARLAALSSKVLVARDNQHVIDASDTVFLAIRPNVAEEVVRALRFRPDQKVVSLVATVDQAALGGWIGVPAGIARAVPLPFVATRNGVTAIFPPDEEVEALFSTLGTAVSCKTIEEFDLLAAASATMGLYFGVMDHVVGWMQARGLPQESARAYLARHFSSLSTVAMNNPSVSLEDLRHDYSTKGGLNEQVFNDFRADGGLSALTQALDNVLARIRAR